MYMGSTNWTQWVTKKRRNEVGIRDSGREVDLGEVRGTGNEYHQIYTVYMCDMIVSWN